MPDQYKYTKYYDIQFRVKKYNCLDNETVELLFIYQLFDCEVTDKFIMIVTLESKVEIGRKMQVNRGHNA